jgi:hypothetical protein
MNVKELRVKIHLIQFFGFNLGHLNMYTYYVKYNQISQRTIKRTHIIFKNSLRKI